ncbi:MAG: beta-ketoacyl synthase N-terminal-like domain-containing protein [Xenococcaceae cyanobacterium]
MSYILGFNGPAFQLDTACSSSLVALHQACQSLRAKDCNLAVVGGVNLMLSPIPSIFFCKTRVH